MPELKCPRCRAATLATVERGLAACSVDAKTGEIAYSGETSIVMEPHALAQARLIHCLGCGHEWMPMVLWPQARSARPGLTFGPERP